MPNTLDLYFGDARSKLIELAAFLDRIDRADPKLSEDFRVRALYNAMEELKSDGSGNRTERILLSLSDHSKEPIEKAHTKAAYGACPPRDS